jgi:hypothetical protein
MSFLMKLALFLPLILLFLGAYVLSSRESSYRIKRANLIKNADQIELLSFGSSHGYYGFNPDRIRCMKAYNMANVSQSLILDSKLLNKYQPQLPRLKAAVFFISYFSFEGLTTSVVEPGRNSFYVRYYGLSETPDGWYDLPAHLMMLSVVTKDLFHQALSSAPDRNLGENGWYHDASDGTKTGLINDDMGKFRVELHEKLMDAKFQPLILEEFENALNHLPESTQAYLVISPVLANYAKFENPRRWENVLFTVGQLAQKHANVKVITSPDSLLSETDFMNPDHLNIKGANKFTDYLNSKICGDVATA